MAKANKHWTRFWVAARYWFGFDQDEARVLWDALQAETGFDPQTDKLRDYLPEAADLLDDVVEEADETDDRQYVETIRVYEDEPDVVSLYELDDDWPDDEWLDAGVEYEITADYEEDA